MIAKVLRDRIVADVCGDLSPSDSEQLLYELLQKPEARQLHQSLQRDRQSIQNLHRLSADPELSSKVLGIIAKQAPIIRITKANTTATRRWLQCVGLALGLALAFVAVGLIPERSKTKVAANRSEKTSENQLVQTTPEASDKKPVPPVTTPDDIVIETPDMPDTTPPIRPPVKPAVKSSNDVLTAPKLPTLTPVEVVKPRISLPMMASDLAADATRETFRKELKGYLDPSIAPRIELFSHDPSKLADDIIKLIKMKSPPIVVEQPVAEAIRRKAKGPTVQFAAYMESCSPDELLAHLKTFARDGKFETLVLTPINEGDHRELRALLGRGPLDSSTENGQKSEAMRPTGDAAAVSGYMSVYPPPKWSGQTKDQKAYWERRVERSPGKLRLYLIIRPI